MALTCTKIGEWFEEVTQTVQEWEGHRVNDPTMNPAIQEAMLDDLVKQFPKNSEIRRFQSLCN